MKNKVKRILCLMFVAALVLSTNACGTKEEASTDKKAETQQTTASTKENSTPEKTYEISWMAANCSTIEDGNWCQRKIEEKLNIKIKTQKVDILQTQQVDLMLASGEMPDCGWIMSKTPQELYDQGLTRTVSRSLIEKHAPEYTKLLNDNPLGWKINLATGKTDEYMSLSGYHSGNSDSLAFISAYRYDWLENLGIKPNGNVQQIDADGKVFMASEPFTQEQFTNILEGFTKSDPDKNGKDDTYGMAACTVKSLSWLPFMGMFGFQDSGSIEENGKAVEYYVSNAYKEFLKYANDLYKKGYLDKEFPTLNHTKMWEKVESEKAGYCSTVVGYTNASLSAYQHRPPMCMILKNPNAKVLITPPEIGANGKGGTRAYTFTNYAYNFFVNKKVDDDKLAKILEMFDYINFDKEAKFMLRYGEEGTHFTWSGEPNNSTPKQNEGVKNGGSTGLFSYNSNYIAETDMKKLLEDSQNRKVGDFARGDWTKYLWRPYKYDILNNTKYQEYFKQSGNAITTLVDEFFFKAIVGEVNLESDWDKYIKQLNDAGYSKLEEELNKAPLFTDVLKGQF